MRHARILFHRLAVLQDFRRGRRQEFMRLGADVAGNESDLLAALEHPSDYGSESRDSDSAFEQVLPPFSRTARIAVNTGYD